MNLLAKMVWLAGAALAFILLAIFMIGGALVGLGGGGWTPAYLGLPGAILLSGILAATFHRTFPDRWP